MTLRDNGDGTISDSRTGLIWQQPENAQEMNYDDAVAFCESLRLAGHSNWRLPNKEELTILAQVGDEQLRALFPNLQQKRYWAFTYHSELSWMGESPDRLADRMAYTVEFDPGSDEYCLPTTSFRFYNYCVRAVSTGSQQSPAKK